MNNMFSFAPDRGWQATYELDGKAWTLPVIGWACMNINDEGGGYRQEVEPVVLGGTTAEPHSFYRERHPGVVLMKLTDTKEAS